MTKTDEAPAGNGATPINAPDYMSYSRMNSILTCGEQFRLSRILKVDEKPHWSAVAGNAIHEAIEKLLKSEYQSERDAR